MSKRNESKSNPLQLRSPAINKNIESSNAKSVFSKSPSYDVVPVKSKLSEMMLGFDYSYKLSALWKYLFERLRNVINKYDELDHRREVIRKKKKAQKHNEVDITESDITPEPDSAVSKTGPYSIKFEKGSTNNIDEEVSIFMDHLDLNTKVFRKQIEKFYSLPERAEKLEKVEKYYFLLIFLVQKKIIYLITIFCKEMNLKKICMLSRWLKLLRNKRVEIKTLMIFKIKVQLYSFSFKYILLKHLLIKFFRRI